MTNTALYRVRQFFTALTAAPPDTTQLGWVEAILTPQQLTLFQQMLPSDQQHSLRVAAALKAQGADHPDLLVAALLHDVGKIRFPLRLGERVLIVLGKALLPRQAARWGEGEPRGWKRPFVVAQQHPAWGAELARQAGVSPLAASLIQRHQATLLHQPSTLEDRLLARLQAADNCS